MRRLSDYKGEEAIELWADLLDPLTEILGDPKIAKNVQAGLPRTKLAAAILKDHAKEAEQIMLRIDPTPVDAMNVFIRLMGLLSEIGQNDEIKSFFGYAAQATTETGSSGSAMESTEGEEK